MSEEQKQSNRRKSKVRSRVEHIFGAQQAMGGHLVRTIGLARAKVKIGLMNLIYNMRRLAQLLARDAKAFARTLSASHGQVASIAAENERKNPAKIDLGGLFASKSASDDDEF